MLELQEDSRKVKRAESLLKAHKAEIMEELGASAFDLLTPNEVKTQLGTGPTELTRQGWLEPAPGKDIGPAHLYYRWRVEFVKRFRKPYKNSSHPT